MMYVITAILGLIIGSFLNVCIYRIPENESIVYGRSKCTKCNHKIKYYDLIPIFSYIMLKGRCRECKEKISIRYPIIEFVNAVLYLVIYYTYGMTIKSVIIAIVSSLMLVIAMIDFDKQIIPDSLSLFMAILGLIYRIYLVIYQQSFIPLYDGILTGIVSFAVFYLLMVVSKNGMGGGDVKLIFGIGLLIGAINMPMLVLISSITAFIYAIIMIQLSKATRKTPIPFGTFLALGTYIMMIIK